MQRKNSSVWFYTKLVYYIFFKYQRPDKIPIQCFFFLSDPYIEPYSTLQIGKMKIYLRKKHPNVFQNKLTKIFKTQRIIDLIKLVECFGQFDHHKIALLIYNPLFSSIT